MEVGCFVLLTTVAKDAADAGEVPSLEREQHGVEQIFTFLKGPTIGNAIFLKSERLIEALGLIPPISLLIRGLMERRSPRRHVEATGHPLTGWYNKPTISPIVLMTTSKFKSIIVIRIGSYRKPNRLLKPVQLDWLTAFDLTSPTFSPHCPELDELQRQRAKICPYLPDRVRNVRTL